MGIYEDQYAFVNLRTINCDSTLQSLVHLQLW